MVEIEDGMPSWGLTQWGRLLSCPRYSARSGTRFGRRPPSARLRWPNKHLSQGREINDKDPAFFGLTPLSMLLGPGNLKWSGYCCNKERILTLEMKMVGWICMVRLSWGAKSVQLLIENGVDIKARASNGITARDLAKTDWTSPQFISQSLQLRVD